MTHNEKKWRGPFSSPATTPIGLAMIRELMSFLPANNLEDAPRRAHFRLSDTPRRIAQTPSSPADPQKAVRHQGRHPLHRGRLVSSSSRFHETFREKSRCLAFGAPRRPPRGHRRQSAGFPSPAFLDINASVKRRAVFRSFLLLRRLQIFRSSPSRMFPAFFPAPSRNSVAIIRHGAKLLFAFAEATVPKNYRHYPQGLRRRLLASWPAKHIRTDANFAWPTAEIAVMGPEGRGGHCLQNGTWRKFPNRKREKTAPGKKIAEFREPLSANPFVAAERGYIGRGHRTPPITPRPGLSLPSARLRKTNATTNPQEKKHGNIPL